MPSIITKVFLPAPIIIMGIPPTRSRAESVPNINKVLILALIFFIATILYIVLTAAVKRYFASLLSAL